MTPPSHTLIESIRHQLYPLTILIRRGIEYMKKFWEQMLLMALAYCLGLFSPYVRDIAVAGAGASWWAKGLYILAGAVAIVVVMVLTGKSLRRLYTKEEGEKEKKETERDEILRKLNTTLERLVQRMEDGKID